MYVTIHILTLTNQKMYIYPVLMNREADNIMKYIGKYPFDP